MRASFLGYPIDVLKMADTVEPAGRTMRTRQQHVALKVAKFVRMRFDPVVDVDVAGSDVIRIDGMGIVWRMPSPRRERFLASHRDAAWRSVHHGCRWFVRYSCRLDTTGAGCSASETARYRRNEPGGRGRGRVQKHFLFPSVLPREADKLSLILKLGNAVPDFVFNPMTTNQSSDKFLRLSGLVPFD
jgi:hypothetical protein